MTQRARLRMGIRHGDLQARPMTGVNDKSRTVTVDLCNQGEQYWRGALISPASAPGSKTARLTKRVQKEIGDHETAPITKIQIPSCLLRPPEILISSRE